MKESLRALYLDNDSLSFQHLLGFTEVTVDVVDEVFDAAELDVKEETRPEESKDDIHNKNVESTKVTSSEESSETTFNAETLQCSLCQFKCETGEALKQHESNLHRGGEEKLAEKSDLNEDKKGIIRQSLHCGKCDQKFRHGKAFRRHKLVKHNENKEDVEKEWESLQQNFQWKCEMCGNKFLDQYNLRVHTKREHPIERSNMAPYDTFPCVKCDRKFRHGVSFRQHKISKHSENEEEVEKEWEALKENFKWPCEVCGKKFLDQHNLKVHMKREHPVKKTSKKGIK